MFRRVVSGGSEVGARGNRSRVPYFDHRRGARFLRVARPSRRDGGNQTVSPMVGCDFHSADRIVPGWQDPQAPGLPRGITILKDYLQRIRCEFLLAQTPAHQLPPGRDRPGEWREPPLVIPGPSAPSLRLRLDLPHCSAHAVVFSFHKRTPDFASLRRSITEGR